MIEKGSDTWFFDHAASDELTRAIRAAVLTEIQAFTQHLRDTMAPGLTVDQWIMDALQWYAERDDSGH